MRREHGRVRIRRQVEQQRVRPGVHDLVGRERAPEHEGASPVRRGEGGGDRVVVERQDPAAGVGGEVGAQRRCERVDQDAGRPGLEWLGQGGLRRGRDGRLDPLDQPGGRILDVAGGVARDDQPVVREQGEAGRGCAGARLVLGAGGADGVGEGQARVRVGHPDHAVPEEPPGKLGPVPVAADGVHEDRVRMEHEALGKQRVEQELDRGASPAGRCQPCLHRHAHHGVVAGVGHGRVALEHLQQARRVQRHEGVGLEGGERDAARLDPEDAIGLGGGVAAATAREPGSSPNRRASAISSSRIAVGCSGYGWCITAPPRY